MKTLSNEKTEKRYLECCRNIEQQLAELYRLLAEKPTHDHGLRELWLQAAEDKDHRAHQFDLAQQRAEADDQTRHLELHQIRAAQAFVSSVLDQVRLAHLSPTLALRLAIRLEESTERAHTQATSSCKRPSTLRTLKAMTQTQRSQREQLHVALHQRLASPQALAS